MKMISFKACMAVGFMILVCSFSFAENITKVSVFPKVLQKTEKISKHILIEEMLNGSRGVDSPEKAEERAVRSRVVQQKASESGYEFSVSRLNPENLIRAQRVSARQFKRASSKSSVEAVDVLRYLPHIAFSDGWIGQITVKNDVDYAATVTLRFNDPDGYMENVAFYVDDDDTLYMGNDVEVFLYPYQSVALDLVYSEYNYRDISVTMWGDTEAFSISANYMRYADDDYGPVPMSGFAVNSAFEDELAEGYELVSRMGFDPYSDFDVTGGFALFNPYDTYMDVYIEMRDVDGNTIDWLFIQNIPPFGKYVNTLNSSELFGNVNTPLAVFEFQAFEAGTESRLVFSMVGGKFKGWASISQPVTGFFYY